MGIISPYDDQKLIACVGSLSNLAVKILAACGTSEYIKEIYVVRPWMHVTTSLLALERNKTPRPDGDYLNISDRLHYWRKFGDALGIDEPARRKDDAERARVAMRGLIGCSWYKCPMFQRDLERPMMACSTCRKVRNRYS